MQFGKHYLRYVCCECRRLRRRGGVSATNGCRCRAGSPVPLQSRRIFRESAVVDSPETVQYDLLLRRIEVTGDGGE